MTEMCVTVASHHFVVTRVNPRVRPAIEGFSKTLIQYSFIPQRGGSYRKEPFKVFAAATRARTEFRYHINSFPAFKEHLKQAYINDGMVEWRHITPPEAADVSFTFKPSLTDKEEQAPAIEYITSDDGPTSRIVVMQTGKGKSYCAQRGMQHFHKRVVILIKPGYIQQWVADLKDKLQLKNSDIAVIQGLGDVKSLLAMAEIDELPYKVIIVSNRTYLLWLKEYEINREYTLEEGYACLPQDFFGHIKAGYRLIDEVHQDFHLNFKCDLYTNIAHSLSLSATLESDNDFINKMYEIAYPKRLRFAGLPYDKYVAAYSLQFSFANPERIRTTQHGSPMYSHHAFEETVIKQPKVLYNYMEMIGSSIENTYIKNFKPGHKCLVFCHSIDMCDRVTAHLKEHFPSYDVRRYVGGDPEEDLREPQIIVSNLLKTGTAIDIPGLSAVIFTPAVNSTQSNVQGFGRLRKLLDGSTPEFIYFVCEDIIKHLDYHEKKKGLLASRALTYTKRLYSKLI